MSSRTQLQDMRAWWVRVKNPFRNSVLRLIDSHLAALERLDALHEQLAEARAAGRRDGLEEAASIAQGISHVRGTPRAVARELRGMVLSATESAASDAAAALAALAALWACPTVRADHDAMHTGEPLTADAEAYRDALAELKRLAEKGLADRAGAR